MFTNKRFQYVTDANSDEKIYMKNHKEFHERIRKTLYYGKYTDGTLPSATVTDVAVKLINSKASGKKALDKCHAARMARRARISPCALMMGILYTERLAQSNPGYLKKVSSSDLFMVSMLVASKYLYDDGEDEDVYNYDWSKAGNYHIRDLNRLEREFLHSIEWKIFVSSKEFFEFVNKVETRVALDHGTERGWYSYMDMGSFLDNVMFQNLIKQYLKHTAKAILSCTLAYSLSVALLFSTPAILNSYEQQSVADIEKELALLPAMSFLAHIGQTEHAMAISFSLRKRQPTQANRNFSSLKSNLTEKDGKTCYNCQHSQTDYISYKAKRSFVVKPIKHSGLKLCTSGIPCIMGNDNILQNKTQVMSNKDFSVSFNQVLSFMKFSFNRSWVYRSVKFPVWENSYSGILIGFSTSSAAAAA